MELGFLLKKLISMFLMPLPFCCLLILLGLLLSFRYLNLGRALAFAGVCLLLLFSWQPFANKALYPLENQYVVFDIQQPVDAIMVLGNCHKNRADIPTLAQLCGTGLYRVMEGFRIWQANPDAMLLVSGYKGDSVKAYAEVAADALRSLGVPDDKLMLFPNAQDTEEEALHSAPYLVDKTFALVTSGSHMPRSMQWFELQGLSPIPAPAHFAANKFSSHKIETPALLKTERAWYELLGHTWLSLKQWLNS